MSSSRQLNPIEFIGMSDQVVAFTNKKTQLELLYTSWALL